MKESLKLWTICAILFVIMIVCALLSDEKKRPKLVHQEGSCSLTSCTALDKVNDPDYNVREAIKQTLLLEQHLAEKAKYCKPCITKHFLLIESLLEESVWMACNRCKDYPKLEESVEFFKKLFEEWHSNMDDEKVRVDVLTKLRDWRREMVELYYFDGKKHS